MTYPHICFSVDNFDEIFNEVTVRDGETIGIELTATDPKHESIVNTVLVNFFSGCAILTFNYHTTHKVLPALSGG